MAGPVALVGGGEFSAALTAIDSALLALTGRRRPRVAIVAGPRAASLGESQFGALGAEVEAVELRDRHAADDPAHAQAIGEADVMYVADGPVATLRAALRESAVWAATLAAHARGAVLVGAGGGAGVLGVRATRVAPRLGWPLGWAEGLGAAAGVAVLPSYDARPEPVMAVLALGAPRGLAVLGIDRETAVIGRDGAWEVHGHGRVTLWRGRHRQRHRRGDAFRVD
jgi:cyanophycinase